jgi:hypothetical protein
VLGCGLVTATREGRQVRYQLADQRLAGALRELARVVLDSPVCPAHLGPGRGQRPHRLASRRVIPAGAKMQVDPASLPLDLIDLAFAVVLTAGLEGRAARHPEGTSGGL